MPSIRLVALLALVVMLAGCRSGDDISVNGHSITLHASGAPPATITATGAFSVGRESIPTSAAQQALLKRYYQGVVTVHRDTDALKKAGVAMAGHAMQTLGVALGGSASSAKAASVHAKAIEAKGADLEKLGDRLCRKATEVATVQASLAEQLAAFRPYAGVDPAADVSCM